MDNINKKENEFYMDESIKDKEKEDLEASGPSELALSLRKNRINKIIGKIRNSNEEKIMRFGKEEIKKLCDLSNILYEEKDEDKIIDILDQTYFFLIRFNQSIKSNYIDLSKIIPHLYTKLALLKEKENIILKIFDILDNIIRLTESNEIMSKYCRIFNEQYCRTLSAIIEIYQNKSKLTEKFFNFLCNLTQKSDTIKCFLMTEPGFFFLKIVLGLDSKYPNLCMNLMSSFCTYNYEINEKMKDFQILFIEKCNKIITLFYDEDHIDPKNVINNSCIFTHLYKCLSYISLSYNKDVLDIFFIPDRNNVTLFEKMLTFENLDKDHLCNEALKIIGNLFNSNEITHIQNLIEYNSYQYVMDILLEKFNKDNIIKNAAWAMSNFVNNEHYRKIFIQNKYINDLIGIIRSNNNYLVIKDLLYIISNFLEAAQEYEIISLVDSDITSCCSGILTNNCEPTILIMTLKIVNLLLLKGDPNVYYECYYKNSDDKVINPFKYQLECYGIYDILENLINIKNDDVYEKAQKIIEDYFDINNKILND